MMGYSGQYDIPMLIAHPQQLTSGCVLEIILPFNLQLFIVLCAHPGGGEKPTCGM